MSISPKRIHDRNCLCLNCVEEFRAKTMPESVGARLHREDIVSRLRGAMHAMPGSNNIAVSRVTLEQAIEALAEIGTTVVQPWPSFDQCALLLNLAERYRNDPTGTATKCDTELDRSGMLLGLVRSVAALHLIKQPKTVLSGDVVAWQMKTNPSVFYPASHRPTDINNFRPLVAVPSPRANAEQVEKFRCAYCWSTMPVGCKKCTECGKCEFVSFYSTITPAVKHDVSELPPLPRRLDYHTGETPEFSANQMRAHGQSCHAIGLSAASVPAADNPLAAPVDRPCPFCGKKEGHDYAFPHPRTSLPPVPKVKAEQVDPCNGCEGDCAACPYDAPVDPCNGCEGDCAACPYDAPVVKQQGVQEGSDWCRGLVCGALGLVSTSFDWTELIDKITSLRTPSDPGAALTDAWLDEELHSYFSFSGKNDNVMWANIEDIKHFARFIAARLAQKD